MSTSEVSALARSDSPEQTEALGREIGGRCVGGEIIALVGALGAGKTRFVRGLAEGLGADPSLVMSPTVVLHRRYAGRVLELEHVDAYRLSGAAEWENLDPEDWARPSRVLAIEWADRVLDGLRRDRLTMEFTVAGEFARHVRMSAWGDSHARLIDGLALR